MTCCGRFALGHCESATHRACVGIVGIPLDALAPRVLHRKRLKAALRAGEEQPPRKARRVTTPEPTDGAAGGGACGDGACDDEVGVRPGEGDAGNGAGGCHGNGHSLGQDGLGPVPGGVGEDGMALQGGARTEVDAEGAAAGEGGNGGGEGCSGMGGHAPGNGKGQGVMWAHGMADGEWQGGMGGMAHVTADEAQGGPSPTAPTAEEQIEALRRVRFVW